MKIAVDTNILVRAIVDDDPVQARAARKALRDADAVAIALPALCELVWVLSESYGAGRAEIAAALRRLLDSANVVANRLAAEAGLAVLEAGGDFADGAIAFEGASLAAECFVSFDRKAVRLLSALHVPARVLG